MKYSYILLRHLLHFKKICFYRHASSQVQKGWLRRCDEAIARQYGDAPIAVRPDPYKAISSYGMAAVLCFALRIGRYTADQEQAFANLQEEVFPGF